jgi:hypothetical protein
MGCAPVKLPRSTDEVVEWLHVKGFHLDERRGWVGIVDPGLVHPVAEGKTVWQAWRDFRRKRKF